MVVDIGPSVKWTSNTFLVLSKFINPNSSDLSVILQISNFSTLENLLSYMFVFFFYVFLKRNYYLVEETGLWVCFHY